MYRHIPALFVTTNYYVIKTRLIIVKQIYYNSTLMKTLLNTDSELCNFPFQRVYI